MPGKELSIFIEIWRGTVEFSAGDKIIGASVAESNVTLQLPYGDVHASKLLAASW